MIHQQEQRTLDNLEFSKILALIAGFAWSAAAKESINALRPHADRMAIDRALDELEELLVFLDRGRHLPIGGVRDIRGLLPLLHAGREILSGDDLLILRANLEVAQAVRRALLEEEMPRLALPGNSMLPLLRARVAPIPDWRPIAQRITDAISDKGEVRDDASPALAKLRRELIRTREEIERGLSDLVRGASEVFQDSYFTLRNDRYVVPVVASRQNAVPGIIHDQSGSGQTVFLEPLSFLEGNNRLVRLRASEREEVRRILAGLTDMVRQRVSDLEATMAELTFLDALMARARFTRAYNANRPIVTDDWLIDLREARHPLLHPDCVPLSVVCAPSQACIVLTGPNGGGKTVALKIVGINILLLQSGCFPLCASGSHLPIVGEVLADIGEAQSIEDHLSTFTARLRRLKEMLERCDARTVLLLDEIGVGTDPEEGAALAYGVLKEVRRRGAFALATTHYEALKQAAFTTPGLVNACMEFDERAFRPTFRFMMGVPGRSNALAMARLFGLPEEVLTDLQEVRAGRIGDESRLLEALERERQKAEEFRRAWEEKSAAVERQERALTSAMQQLAEFRRSKRDELTEKFGRDLKDKVRTLEALIHGIKARLARHDALARFSVDLGAEKPGDEVDLDPSNDLARARAALRTAQSELRTLDDLDLAPTFAMCPGEVEYANFTKASPQPLAVGDRVMWIRSSCVGFVEQIDKDRDRLVVEIDGKRVVLPQSEVRAAPHPKHPL